MGSKLTTEAALLQFNTNTLKEMIRHVCPGEKPTRKFDMISVLERSILDEERLKSAWKKLDEVEKLAVAEAVYSAHNSFDMDFFEAKYGALPNYHKSMANAANPSSTLNVFFIGGRIPDDLKELIRPFVPEPPAVSISTLGIVPQVYEKIKRSYQWQDGDDGITVIRRGAMFQIPKQEPKAIVKTTEIPVTVSDTMTGSLYDLKTVLHLVELGKLVVSDKTMRPTSSTVALIAEKLATKDFFPANSENPDVRSIKSFAWPMLLQGADLAEANGKKLTLTKTGVSAVSQPSFKSIKQIWDYWLLTRCDEFQRIDAIKGQSGKGARLMTHPSTRRAVIVDGLLKCPQNEWISVSEFSRVLRATKLHFEVAQNLWHLYITDPNYGNFGFDNGFAAKILRERYIKCFLMEYAATLGLIDVAYVHPEDVTRDFNGFWGVDDLPYLSRYDGLLYFRINDLGAYCLGLTAAFANFEQSPSSVIKVSSNLIISLTEETVAPDVTLLLDAFAERESHSSWRLSQSKAAGAVERGHRISELSAFLQSHDEQPLPQTVEAFIKKMEANGNALHHKCTASLIECANSKVANEIASSDCTKHLCRKLDEHTLVVYASDFERFRNAIHLLGFCLPPS